VAGILRSHGWTPKNDVQRAYYLIAQSDWSELIILGEPAVKPLIKALNFDFYSDEHGKAAETLGDIGGSVACEALIQTLGDQDWFLRQAAAASLGKIRDQRALEPLINALNDENRFVRQSTVTRQVAFCESYKASHTSVGRSEFICANGSCQFA
jgi:HEAT repeat protein